MIHQGDIYWIDQTELSDLPHPYVVVQEDLFNQSRIHSVVVCALTTNPKKRALPGNVMLEVGEGGLLKPSVVEVSKITAVEKTSLGRFIGRLPGKRVEQILAGLQFIQTGYLK